MKISTMSLIGVFTLGIGAVGCGDDDGGNECTDECTTENDTQCAGTVIQRCAVGADGCLEWVDTVDCGANQKICDDTVSPATCRLDCFDDCDAEGDTQCSGEVVQTCELGGDGCLDWVDGTDCASINRVCDAGGGTSDATCVRDCTDQCGAEGDTQCAGTVIQTCELNALDCLDWVDGTDCDDSGLICDDATGDASCMVDCSLYHPDTPTGPTPADGASEVEPATVTSLDWDDAAGATGYDVYWGTTCPPPAYPSAGYTAVTASALTGLSFSQGATYCWKVVALDDNLCSAEGPEWTFTTSCTDPVAGPPAVTSSDATMSAGGSYLLTFSEDVLGVAGNLTLTAVSGSGTLGAVTAVSAQSYQVAISGAAPGDVYTLTVGTGVTDICHTALAAPVDLTITIEIPEGMACSDPEDLTGASFPVQLTGTFDDDPASGPSCDTTPNNVVWYTFTPSTTGLYEIQAGNQTTTIAFSRLAVFEGTACGTYGTEVDCVTAISTDISTTVSLTQGTTYLIMFFTDGDTYTMVDPSISIVEQVIDPGEGCSNAVDVTSETFPYPVSGTYTLDGTGTSCASDAYNAVYFSYTPSTSDWYYVTGSNVGGSGSTGIAVLDGLGCDPYGAELDCAASTTTDATAHVYLEAGLSYLVAFHSGAAADFMVDPRIDIAFAPPPPAGEVCMNPLDVTGASFPVQSSGTFDRDPGGGSCAPDATNAIWYSYTAPSDGLYQIDLVNNTTTYAFSRVAVYEGTTCAPQGVELTCRSASDVTVSTLLDLTAGTTYLIQFYTDGDTYTMVDPEITISPVTPAAGQWCTTAIDVTGASFPYAVTGTFDLDPERGGSCAPEAYNAVFFSYTPQASDWYYVTGRNVGGSGETRMAVFEGTGCSPYGLDRGCDASATLDASAHVSLTAGTDYLFVFYTDDDTSPMVDPSIEVAVAGTAPMPGLACNLPAQVGDAMHYVDGSGHDCWQWPEDQGDTVNDHLFTCDTIVGGDVVVAFTTGASQTTLSWDAVLTNPESPTDAYVGIEVTDAPCATGASLHCFTASNGTHSDTGSVTVSPNTTYYLWVTDAWVDHYRPLTDLCVW